MAGKGCGFRNGSAGDWIQRHDGVRLVSARADGRRRIRGQRLIGQILVVAFRRGDGLRIVVGRLFTIGVREGLRTHDR